MHLPRQARDGEPQRRDRARGETFESALAFGRAALESLELDPDRISSIEAEVRECDDARFALQQQGQPVPDDQNLLTRPVPLIEPKKRRHLKAV